MLIDLNTSQADLARRRRKHFRLESLAIRTDTLATFGCEKCNAAVTAWHRLSCSNRKHLASKLS